MTELLAKDGYDMIGADNSPEMLEIAREKQVEEGLDILYLQQDMRSFELYGTVAAVVSCCDSLNYILEEEGLFAGVPSRSIIIWIPAAFSSLT